MEAAGTKAELRCGPQSPEIGGGPKAPGAGWAGAGLPHDAAASQAAAESRVHAGVRPTSAVARAERGGVVAGRPVSAVRRIVADPTQVHARPDDAAREDKDKEKENVTHAQRGSAGPVLAVKTAAIQERGGKQLETDQLQELVRSITPAHVRQLQQPFSSQHFYTMGKTLGEGAYGKVGCPMWLDPECTRTLCVCDVTSHHVSHLCGAFTLAFT